jgi:hypothetical protein
MRRLPFAAVVLLSSLAARAQGAVEPLFEAGDHFPSLDRVSREIPVAIAETKAPSSDPTPSVAAPKDTPERKTVPAKGRVNLLRQRSEKALRCDIPFALKAS